MLQDCFSLLRLDKKWLIKYRVEVRWYAFAFSGWKGTKAQNDHTLGAAGHAAWTLIGESISEEANCYKFVNSFLRREKNCRGACSQRWPLPICISSPTLWQTQINKIKYSTFPFHTENILTFSSFLCSRCFVFKNLFNIYCVTVVSKNISVAFILGDTLMLFSYLINNMKVFMMLRFDI